MAKVAILKRVWSYFQAHDGCDRLHEATLETNILVYKNAMRAQQERDKLNQYLDNNDIKPVLAYDPQAGDFDIQDIRYEIELMDIL